MRFKELFTGKSPLRLNGDKSNKLSYRQMEKDMVNAHWTKFKKDLDAGKYYSKTKPLTHSQEREIKRKHNPPQSGAIEITSGPETFFAGPGTKATGFVLKKGADLMKSKVAKVAKNLGKNVAGAYAEAGLGL